MEKQISDILDILKDMKADIAELKSDVAELKSDVAELKSDVAELQKGQITLKAEIVKLSIRMDRLEEQRNVDSHNIAKILEVQTALYNQYQRI